MILLKAENVTKSYGDRRLFKGLNFSLGIDNKVALVAKNGQGKSTLFKILVGEESMDTGEITIPNGVKIAYLSQNPKYVPEKTIKELVCSIEHQAAQALSLYEQAMEDLENYDLMDSALNAMENAQGWDFETKAKTILSALQLPDWETPVGPLSGGQKRRLALAMAFLDEPDLLLLDEPTNHLDLESTEWLEGYLKNLNIGLLLITHDRSFLNNVCNTIWELNPSGLQSFPGNFQVYLDRKTEQMEIEARTNEKNESWLKKELVWMRRQPKARTTKSKARQEAFHEMKERTMSLTRPSAELQLGAHIQRLGNKVLEIKDLEFAFPDKPIITSFSYNFIKGEKIGIVGKNGTGKSSFLNLLAGDLTPKSGTIDWGETSRLAFYRQSGMHIPDGKRVLEIVTDIAETVQVSKNETITASQFLQRFGFEPARQHVMATTLSGGEQKRLYLVTLLMKQGNFLVLDEPTNDLDVYTLAALEQYLESYPGCVLVVTHDRTFLDKVVSHLFVFEGQGEIKDFNGTYDEYRTLKKLLDAEGEDPEPIKAAPAPAEPAAKATSATTASSGEQKPAKKLSFKEKQELEQIESKMETLDKQIAELSSQLSAGDASDYQAIQKITSTIEVAQAEHDTLMARWMELSEG